MRKIGLVVVVLAACSGSGAHLPKTAQGSAVIEIRGAVKNGPFSLGRADLEKLPQVTVRGVDPTSGTEAVWEGVPVAALVARVELGRGADTVIVRTADGAAIPIPLTVVRQFRPTLADRANGTRLATRVLAWPTLEQRGIETDPRHVTWWARNIVALELADWQRTYGVALATPEGAPDAARRGSTWYAERCVTCHKMRGVGGTRGPDLTTVAARLGQAPFETLLDKHPGWAAVTAGDAPGDRGVQELWTFLRAVSVAPARPEPLTAERAGTASSSGR